MKRLRGGKTFFYFDGRVGRAIGQTTMRDFLHSISLMSGLVNPNDGKSTYYELRHLGITIMASYGVLAT
jgi:hypothetical protein